MKNGWIKLNKENQTLERAVDSVTDNVKIYLNQIKLQKLNEVPAKEIDNLKRRKLVATSYARLVSSSSHVNTTRRSVKAYKACKGPKYSLDNWNVQMVTDINSTMLEKYLPSNSFVSLLTLLFSGAWKTAVFKPFNFNSLGVFPNGGHLHPLLKVRAEFRQIFFELGFAHRSLYLTA